MIAALKAEYRKFTSTRMWWILLLVMAGYLAFMAGVVAASSAYVMHLDDVEYDGFQTALSAYSIANPIGYVFPLIIGTLAVTTEFRHKTITGTLLVQPNRTRLIITKLLASIPTGLLYGLAATLVVVLVSAPLLILIGDGAYLGESEILQVIGFSVVAMSLWTIIGVAFGCLVRNQIAAIIILVAFTQFVEPIARFAAMAVEQLSGIGRFFPGAAADAVVGASYFSAMGGDVALLNRWQGALVLLAYAGVFLVVGRLTTFRRDVD